VAVDGTDGSAAGDAEKVGERHSAGACPPADTPGAEPPSLSRAESRAAVLLSNEKPSPEKSTTRRRTQPTTRPAVGAGKPECRRPRP